MQTILSLAGVGKTYKSGHVALKSVDLDIRKGEIFALLGPNGAGKTTMIGIVCGTVSPTSGTITIDGHDAVTDYRRARAMLGLVPQELSTDAFSKVRSTLEFTRGLFGRAPDPAYIEELLRDLSLWDKRDTKIIELSGGMKRRVLIGKALAHKPDILFLDEPTAGVDVALRRDMWRLIAKLRERGTTIILTTHYIEEAEEMADRVGVISKGELLLVEEKSELMKKLGKREMSIALVDPIPAIPPELSEWDLALEGDGTRLRYTFDAQAERTGIPSLLRKLPEIGIAFKDLETHKSSLEDIFVDLVSEKKEQAA